MTERLFVVCDAVPPVVSLKLSLGGEKLRGVQSYSYVGYLQILLNQAALRDVSVPLLVLVSDVTQNLFSSVRWANSDQL